MSRLLCIRVLFSSGCCFSSMSRLGSFARDNHSAIQSTSPFKPTIRDLKFWRRVGPIVTQYKLPASLAHSPPQPWPAKQQKEKSFAKQRLQSMLAVPPSLSCRNQVKQTMRTCRETSIMRRSFSYVLEWLKTRNESRTTPVGCWTCVPTDNPDGKTNVKIGQGCVCWSCGFCGLPKGGGESKVAPGGKKNKMPKTPPGPCGNCGETDQINYVRVTRKGMDDLPWIEAPPLTEEEKKKKKDAELAAKRREVEEQVKKALEDRKKAEASAAQCMAMQGSFMPGQQAGQGVPCLPMCLD